MTIPAVPQKTARTMPMNRYLTWRDRKRQDAEEARKMKIDEGKASAERAKEVAITAASQDVDRGVNPDTAYFRHNLGAYGVNRGDWAKQELQKPDKPSDHRDARTGEITRVHPDGTVEVLRPGKEPSGDQLDTDLKRERLTALRESNLSKEEAKELQDIDAAMAAGKNIPTDKLQKGWTALEKSADGWDKAAANSEEDEAVKARFRRRAKEYRLKAIDYHDYAARNAGNRTSSEPDPLKRVTEKFGIRLPGAQ
jgi:hypothetical protein